MRSFPTLLTVVVVMSLAAAGCGTRTTSAATSPVANSAANLAVTEKDFAIQASVPTIKAGRTSFTVNNSGPSAHEFLIFQAGTAPDALPTGSDGRVDESNSQITKVFDSGDNISAGGSKVFTASLAAGSYVLVCNLPGHYTAGMHQALTVQ